MTRAFLHRHQSHSRIPKLFRDGDPQRVGGEVVRRRGSQRRIAVPKAGAIIATTPASLGVFDALAVVSAQIVGDELAASLLAVPLVRIVALVLSVVGGEVMWRTTVTGGHGARQGVDDGGATY